MNYKCMIAGACLTSALAMPAVANAQVAQAFQPAAVDSSTVALWLFDEPLDLYASAVLNDAGPRDYPLVLGLGARVVAGKFGRALEVTEQPRGAELVDPPAKNDFSTMGAIHFGLLAPPRDPARKMEPMTWKNANFAALMTLGDKHLRNEVGFPNASETALNLGAHDWTLEFWFRPTRSSASDGVVFEIGSGPRGENDVMTQLALNADRKQFTLTNQPANVRLAIPTDAKALAANNAAWHHLAFVYDAASGLLRHFVDGKLQRLPATARLRAVPAGPESYLTIGRDFQWTRALPGQLDELRVSARQVYAKAFTPPQSFAPRYAAPKLAKGAPLLFDGKAKDNTPVQLGARKHLFIDKSLVAKLDNATLAVNPPEKAELVIPDIKGAFRKHVSVIEDEQGNIRLYNGIEGDRVEVHVAKDGVNFQDYETGIEYEGSRNVAVPYSSATGSFFLDPNAPPQERWKYVSGSSNRGTFVFTSPDGYRFTRHPTAVIPMHVGSQANVFWDDQRGSYVGYHRSDCHRFEAGDNSRQFVMTEVTDIYAPWNFRPTTPEDIRAARKVKFLREPQPWFMDNGPLTPGGFCLEYPSIFKPAAVDPEGTDVYVPKAVKYPWAPDVYLAFPTMYFHYEIGPKTRTTLEDVERGLGSGPIETQVEVSRNAVDWQRYPRPAYIGIGNHAGYNVVQAYIAHGMVRRGNEIWQYYFGTEEYHTTQAKVKPRRGIFRVVQRLDGFVSVNTPYEATGTLVTKPLTFDGNRLVLNVDTDATGYVQVGLLDEKGQPIPGYSVDDCVYINGDFVDKEVEWLGKGTDLSAFRGRAIQVVYRMRGSKLFAMQFVQR